VRSIFAASGAVSALILLLASSSARAGWIPGQFISDGKPVHEYHCVPKGAGAHPAVVLLHGAGHHKDEGSPAFEKMCAELAGLGYYTEFIEYYSQTDAVGPEQPALLRQYFPIWLAEIHSGLDALDKNPAVDPHRVALMGFSLGAFLSLSTGAADPNQVAAIVEYYGGLPKMLEGGANTMPPTLILHGDKDVVVPVAMAHTLDELLTKDKRPHEMKIYEGANHGFNFPELAMWYDAPAAQDSWNRTVKFLSENLKASGQSASK
jgi:carboxymethylenebutenolidase